jgi:hypothetical protein
MVILNWPQFPEKYPIRLQVLQHLVYGRVFTLRKHSSQLILLLTTGMQHIRFGAG